MPDNKTQILIELQLEMKKLKSQMKEAASALKNFKKEVAGISSESKKSSREQVKGSEEVSKAAKKAANEAVKAEKSKQDAIKKTLNMLKEQKKAATGAGGGGGGKSGFFGSMMAGAGLGGLSKPITRQSAGSAVGRGLSAIGGGVLGFLTSGASNAYQTYMQYGAARAGLSGLASRKEMAGTNKAGVSMGYTPTETTYQAMGLARSTGAGGAVSRAQQYSRYTGMDVGQLGGYMGSIRQAGYGFGGKTKYGQTDSSGMKEMTKAIEAGMISGLEKGRLPEFLAGVSQITQQIGGRVAGRVNVGNISGFMALLGKSGLPGFQGARGAAVAGQMNQAIQRPGGGEAGQAMMLQALGFGKPGGQTAYYDALKTQQVGLENKGSAINMFKEVYSQLGTTGVGGSAPANQEANLVLSEMTGLSLDQVEKLGDLINSGEISAESMKKIEETLKAAQDPKKAALKEMKQGFVGVKKYIASVEATQIGIGGRFAPMFMQMQKLQLGALKVLSEWLPRIGTWIQETYITLSGFADKVLESMFGKGDIMGPARKKAREAVQDIDPYFKGSLVSLKSALQTRKSSADESYKKLKDETNSGLNSWNPVTNMRSNMDYWFGEGKENLERHGSDMSRIKERTQGMSDLLSAVLKKIPELATMNQKQRLDVASEVDFMLNKKNRGANISPKEYIEATSAARRRIDKAKAGTYKTESGGKGWGSTEEFKAEEQRRRTLLIPVPKAGAAGQRTTLGGSRSMTAPTSQHDVK